MTAAIFYFEDASEPATRLAERLGIASRPITVHHFPDGESRVRVPVPLGAYTAIVYRSLDHPNAKLVELLLAGSALRENGADKLVLVAPYLAYMRQDKAFNPGEAVSQRVIGSVIADHFDALFTLDPHLHRIHDLAQAVPGIEAFSLSAAPVLSAAIDAARMPLLVGPDRESRQWIETIGMPLGLDVLVGEKQRGGDRAVAITIPGIERVKGRPVVLVDDVISSGATIVAAAKLLRNAGAGGVEVLATHCLASQEDLDRLRSAGIDNIRATDTVEGPAASLHIALVLAKGLRSAGFLG